MTTEIIQLNATQKALAQKRNLVVTREGDRIIVIDRDPVLRAKKVKLPRYEGADVDSLILTAVRIQQERHGEKTEPKVAPKPVSTLASVPVPTPVVPRVVVTNDEKAPAREVTGVVLDDTTPTPRRASRKNKPEKTHRDNRFARAYRAIVENPKATVTTQAQIADVTEPMLVWYHGALRSLYAIIYEKHGEGVIPKLPELRLD